LAALGFSTQALATPSLWVSGSCGGEATATVVGTSSYRLVLGEPGSYTLSEGACADTELAVVGTASAPMSARETTVVLTDPHCGASAQVIDLDTCELSEVVVLPAEYAYDVGYEDGCVFAGGTWDSDTGTCDAATCAYTDTDDDTYDDASFLAGYVAGEASVDITSDNADVCTDAGGAWDLDSGTCTAATLVEEPDCWQSSYCLASDREFDTGRPLSKLGTITQEECQEAPYTSNWWLWYDGQVIGGTVNPFEHHEFLRYHLYIHLCE
jgi:hypothetical protein